MPLASGSDAIRGLGDSRRHGNGEADTNMRRNADRKREPGNCANFILTVDLCTQAKHKHAMIVNADRLQITKSAIEDEATMQYFDG